MFIKMSSKTWKEKKHRQVYYEVHSIGKELLSTTELAWRTLLCTIHFLFYSEVKDFTCNFSLVLQHQHRCNEVPPYLKIVILYWIWPSAYKSVFHAWSHTYVYAVKVRRHTLWSRVRCHGSHECWFTHRQFHSQFHSRRHSLRITLKYTTLVCMRST